MTVEKLKKALRNKPKTTPVSTLHYLSTGSTLLNLAFSNLAQGGFVPGLCYSFVGDSNSGKTWLAMSALAEATIDPHFKEYRLDAAVTFSAADLTARESSASPGFAALSTERALPALPSGTGRAPAGRRSSRP